MTTELTLDDARKATWLESAMSQWQIVSPQIGETFTAADVHLFFSEPENPNDYGALFRMLKAAGFIEFLYYVKSPRKSRRGGVTGMWRKRL